MRLWVKNISIDALRKWLFSFLRQTKKKEECVKATRNRKLAFGKIAI
jgi:hypothetical protein